jgi:hypothetical protein
MRIQRVKKLTISDKFGSNSRLCVYYDNMGEPFREGLRIELEELEDSGVSVGAVLSREDLEQLRDTIDAALAT